MDPCAAGTIIMGKASFLKSVTRGSLEKVRSSVAHGPGRDLLSLALLFVNYHEPDERHLEVLRLLLGAGADPDASDDGTGFTPLFYASGGRLEMVRCLVEAGADVRKPIGNGATALHGASVGRPETAEYLIGRGASVGATTDRGETPLHVAVSFGNVAGAELLLRHGASVGAPTVQGATPLHTAAGRPWGHVEEMVRLLLAWGADPAAKDARGLTPFDIVESFAKVSWVLTPDEEQQRRRVAELLRPREGGGA